MLRIIQNKIDELECQLCNIQNVKDDHKRIEISAKTQILSEIIEEYNASIKISKHIQLKQKIDDVANRLETIKKQYSEACLSIKLRKQLIKNANTILNRSKVSKYGDECNKNVYKSIRREILISTNERYNLKKYVIGISDSIKTEKLLYHKLHNMLYELNDSKIL